VSRELKIAYIEQVFFKKDYLRGDEEFGWNDRYGL
jgi:hypothetical protein